MKIGLFLATINPVATPEYIAAFASGAEERGFDSLWVGEHALLFEDYDSAYPYSEDGKLIGLSSESGMLDPFLALGWARHTTWYRRVAVIPISLGVATVGVYWTVTRVVSG